MLRDDGALNKVTSIAVDIAPTESLRYVGKFFHRVSIPGRIWRLSCTCYRRGWRIPAWLLKAVNLYVFRALLPYQCELEGEVLLTHQALGCVFSHAVTIGKNVKISHHVGLAAYAGRIIVEDDVTIDMHAVILGSRTGGILRIGRGSVIGSGAVVNFDVPPHTLVEAAPGHIAGPAPRA